MKTIVVANQKGGVGKSIVSIHLAFHFMEQGFKVKFIDLDPQGNSSSVLRDLMASDNASELFKNPSLSTQPGNHVFLGDIELSNCQENVDLNIFQENISKLLHTADEPCICIIDTAPTASRIQIAPLIVADYVISPIELDEFSISGISNIINTISNIKTGYNPKLNFLGIVPNRVHGVSPRQRQLLHDLQTKYGHLLLSTTISLGERQAVRDAISQRIPVWKLKTKSKAKVEFLDLVNTVSAKIA